MSNFDPTTAENFESLTSWRTSLLKTILNGALIAGIFALPPAIIGSASSTFSALYIGAYLLLLGARFLSMPHALKSAILLSITFGIGLAGLLDTSIWGDSRTFMIAFIVFTSLLVSPSASWYALGLALLSYAIMGWLILNELYLLPTQEVTPGTLASWLSGATTVAVVSVAITQGLRLLQVQFFNNAQRADQFLASLREHQHGLEEQVQTRTTELTTKTKLLNSAAQFARKFSAHKDQADLLNAAVQLISSAFGHDHAGIYLLDEQAEFCYLQSASSASGRQLQSEGFRIELRKLGFLRTSAQNSRPIIHQSFSNKPQPAESAILPESNSRILIALFVKGSVFGILDVQSKLPNAFTLTHSEALQIIADQLSLLIENTILTSEAGVINEQLRALNLNQSRESWSQRGGDQTPAFQYTPLGVQLLAGYKLQDSANPRTLTLPVKLRGQKLGTLRIKRKESENPWDEQEQDIIREIVAQMGLALENARLLEDAQRRVAQEREITEITAHIGASFDVDTILRITAQEIGKVLGDSEVSVVLNQSIGKTQPRREEEKTNGK